ncbi:unnamed protein product [Moneuplotes crassus]|uniref:Uncharacterized protein n=1 Tax=Euplotes crassus TaxID=5936 RepID=A0AAD2D4T7_EUPCR|nr:unnamed protein product [Moneuplotes crassus]
MRKIHYEIWWYGQCFWLLPSFLCFMYNFIYHSDYSKKVCPDDPDCDRRKKNDDSEFKETIKGHALDNFFRIFVYFGIAYYSIDTIYLAVKYGFDMVPCCYTLFLHHIPTVIAAYFMTKLNHYPWFLSFSIFFHCFLIIWPQHKWLNYIYIQGFFCFLYKSNTNPFKRSPLYRKIFWSVLSLFVPTFMLWWFKCSNQNAF